MTDLKAILEYQDADIKLRKTIDSIERSDAARRGKQAKTEFETAKKRVDDSEEQAGEILEFVEKAGETAKQTQEAIEKCKSRLEAGDISAEERKQMRAELESLKAKCADLEKRIESKLKRGGKVVDESRDSQARAKKMRDLFLQEKASFDKLKEQKKPEIDKCKARLAELKPKVDAQLMKMYEELAAEKKIPPFVDAYETSKGSFSCRGCGLQLSQAENAKLMGEGICRCGNCHRVIYIPKK